MGVAMPSKVRKQFTEMREKMSQQLEDDKIEANGQQFEDDKIEPNGEQLKDGTIEDLEDLEDFVVAPREKKRRTSLTVRTVSESSESARFRTAYESYEKGAAEATEMPVRQTHRWRCALASSMVETHTFNMVTGFFILLNAASIGVQTEVMAVDFLSAPPPFWRGVEVAFCIIFSLELALRVGALQQRFFQSREKWWNFFDCFLVLLQITEEIIVLATPDSITKESASSDSRQGGSDFSMLRVLRILRLIRIVRLVRLLRFVSELRTIVVSIFGSMRSLLWTIVLLFLIMYVVGIYVTQVVCDHMIELRKHNPRAFEEQLEIRDFFGTLGQSILTLYMTITGGINWRVAVLPVMENVNPMLVMLFAMYIAFCLFALMNIITGVFVESALQTARQEKDSNMLMFIKNLFNQADINRKGMITWMDLEECLKDEEMRGYFESFEIPVTEAEELFGLLDVAGCGMIGFDTFVNGCFRLRGPARSLDLAVFMHAFQEFVEAQHGAGTVRLHEMMLKTCLELQELTQRIDTLRTMREKPKPFSMTLEI